MADERDSEGPATAPTVDAAPDPHAETLHSDAPASTAETLDGGSVGLLPTLSGPGVVTIERVSLEAPGRYVLRAELGRGGQSLVHAAVDTHLEREVAFKTLHPGAAYDRFVREARLTAKLEHPGVVALHELGRREDGRLYATQKLIRGDTLAAALDRAALLEERLPLIRNLIDVCYAVGFAHEHGVVHRDLKPANIMLGAFGETVVLDWGIARARDEADEVGEDALAGHGGTEVGTVLGTPGYMAPEQARGELDRVDARSDVWSLGAILYEILAGAPAVVGDSMTRIERTLQADFPSLAEVAPDAPPDLVALVERAMAEAPEARFQDAATLAEELEAWRDGRRVSIYDYGSWELLRRFVARNKLAAGFAAAVILLVVVAIVLVSRERDAALANLEEARAQQARVHAERGRRLLREHRHAAAAQAFDEALASKPREDAELGRALAGALGPQVLDEKTRRADAQVRAAELEPGVCVGLGNADTLVSWPCGGHTPLRVLDTAAPGELHLALSADGRRVAHVKEGAIHVFDTASGRRAGSVPVDGPVNALALDADGAHLAWSTARGAWAAPVAGGAEPAHGAPERVGDALPSAGGGADAVERAADGPEPNSPAAAPGLAGDAVERVAADGAGPGSPAAAPGLAGDAVERAAADGPRPGSPAAASSAVRARRLPNAADSTWLGAAGGGWAAVGADGRATLQLLPREGAPDAAVLAALSVDTLWPASEDEALVGDRAGAVHHVARGRLTTLGRHPRRLTAATLSGDGALAAVGGALGEVRVWRTANARGLARFRAPAGVAALRFDDGGGLVVQSRDGSQRLVDLTRPLAGAPVDVGQGRAVTALAWSKSGRLARGDAAGRVAVEGVSVARVGAVRGLAWTADGEALAIAHAEGVEVWRATGVREVAAGDALAVGWAGERLVYARPDQVVAGETSWRAPPTVVTALTVCGDVFVGTYDGEVVRLAAETLGERERLDGPNAPIRALSCSDDEATLAAAAEDGTLALWTLADGRRAWLRGHDDRVDALAFGPRGAWLVSAGADRTVRLWRPDREAPIFTFESQAFRRHRALALAPDAATLVLGDAAGGLSRLPWPLARD